MTYALCMRVCKHVGGTLIGTVLQYVSLHLCFPSVWPNHPLNHIQMVGRGTEGGRQIEYVSVPLSLRLCWCPAVSPVRCAWSSPAAAASFPGTEPFLCRPLLYSDLDGRMTGMEGRRFNAVATYLILTYYVLLRRIPDSNHLFQPRLPLNRAIKVHFCKRNYSHPSGSLRLDWF